MDHRLRWLLDLVATLGWVCWELVKYRNGQIRPTTRVIPFPVARVQRGLVAVLVSRRGMQDAVRRALGDRATLRFVRTWAELQEIVIHTPPTTILADPLADPRGDPESYIRMFSQAWGVPVVLYTELTPASMRVLLKMGQSGVRHVLFYELDDAERLTSLIDWGARRPPPHEPPLRAA